MNKYRFWAIIGFFVCTSHIHSQVFHAIVMINKEEPGREKDRTVESNSMIACLQNIAEALGYRMNMRNHSGSEFTTRIITQEIRNLRVKENDIVVFYYSGHGVNRDIDEWPHMALLDRQYHSTIVYDSLMAQCKQAKLVLCIVACCNMDSEGARREKRSYAGYDSQAMKRLFTGFEGHRSYMTSSSIRGQYSYSCSSGAFYGMSLREALTDVSSGKVVPNLDYFFEAAKQKTLTLSDQKQMPQYSKQRW